MSQRDSTRTEPTSSLPRSLMALPLAVAVIATGCTPGCTQIRESYHERSADDVWVALRAVAEEPRYDDWFVIENSVHAFEDQRRIEIYRELRRDVALPATKVRRENRSYRFALTLADGPPPKVTFTSRGWAVPAHAHTEGMRLLEEVHEILAGAPGVTPVTVPPPAAATPPTPPPPVPAAESPAAVPTPAPEPTRPPVDIDLDE